MEIILDGQTIDSRETLHQRLTELLQLPAWYGKNLDALHDCLTELREPVTLRVIHAHALRETLGGYASGFGHVLDDSERENEKLTVFWEEYEGRAALRRALAASFGNFPDWARRGRCGHRPLRRSRRPCEK